MNMLRPIKEKNNAVPDNGVHCQRESFGGVIHSHSASSTSRLLHLSASVCLFVLFSRGWVVYDRWGLIRTVACVRAIIYPHKIWQFDTEVKNEECFQNINHVSGSTQLSLSDFTVCTCARFVAPPLFCLKRFLTCSLCSPHSLQLEKKDHS